MGPIDLQLGPRAGSAFVACLGGDDAKSPSSQIPGAFKTQKAILRRVFAIFEYFSAACRTQRLSCE